MEHKHKAWLLPLKPNQQIAVAENVMLAYLTQAQIYHVPLAPEHCPALLKWQQQLLPLFTFQNFINTAEKHHYGIFLYQEKPNTTLSMLSIMLQGPPKMILIDDSSAIDWPETLTKRWQALTLALIEHDGIATPIIDINALAKWHSL